MYQRLSKIPNNLTLKEVLLILDNFEGIINDLAIRPHVEYTKEDLEIVWLNLKTYQDE